jgi:HSP20 family protein
MAKKWIPWKKKDKDEDNDDNMKVYGDDRRDWDGRDKFPYRRDDRPSPFDSIFSSFGDFDRLEREMDMMLRRAFEGNLGAPGEGGPYIYGYSMRTGPDGKPEVREFSNFDSKEAREATRLPLRSEPEDKGSCPSCNSSSEKLTCSDTQPDRSGFIGREPLTDLIECDNSISVTIELPGLEKDDIDLRATSDTLTVTVETPERKYRKEFDLPCEIKPNNIKATYKNGILDITLKRKNKQVKKDQGKKIKIE